LAAQRQFQVNAGLIGCHGQTLYHQGESQRFLGRKITATWQTGEGAIIAARTGAPVISDFRPADMAAGGKGAPSFPSSTTCSFATRASDESFKISAALQTSP